MKTATKKTKPTETKTETKPKRKWKGPLDAAERQELNSMTVAWPGDTPQNIHRYRNLRARASAERQAHETRVKDFALGFLKSNLADVEVEKMLDERCGPPPGGLSWGKYIELLQVNDLTNGPKRATLHHEQT